MMSAVDRTMTDGELERIGRLSRFLPVFEGFDDEELAGRAQESGRPPDRAMAMAMLQAFGRPAEYAQRYHARPALVEGADNHHFLIWATGGAVVLVMHAALNPQQHVDLDGLFLQWLGV